MRNGTTKSRPYGIEEFTDALQQLVVTSSKQRRLIFDKDEIETMADMILSVLEAKLENEFEDTDNMDGADAQHAMRALVATSMAIGVRMGERRHS